MRLSSSTIYVPGRSGVERIESDGTLIYTEDARRTAKPFCAELAEPLSPKHWESRLAVLRSFYEHCLRTR